MAQIGPIKWISEEEVRSVLTWDRLVPAMADTLAAVTRDGDVEQPVRTRLYDQSRDGTVLVMPGLVRPANALATKILSMYPGNAGKGLPTHTALVLLMDAATGAPQALVDGCSLTELRTAAASAAATVALREAEQATAGPPVVAVLGAGVQGAAHARVMNHVLKPHQVRLWSRSGSKKLVEQLLQEGVPAVSCESVRDAVEGAAVINTCTLAYEPILEKTWVMEGAHINSVGAARRDTREMSAELVLSAEVFADSRQAALAEAGDVILAGASVVGEIGEVIRGSLTPKRGRTTIYKSLGLAAEDAVAAKLVYDNLYPAAVSS